MLCGLGIYYALSLCTAEYLVQRGLREHDFATGMEILVLGQKVMPFDHRFRDYPIMRISRELEKRHENLSPQ